MRQTKKYIKKRRNKKRKTNKISIHKQRNSRRNKYNTRGGMYTRPEYIVD